MTPIEKAKEALQNARDHLAEGKVDQARTCLREACKIAETQTMNSLEDLLPEILATEGACTKTELKLHGSPEEKQAFQESLEKLGETI